MIKSVGIAKADEIVSHIHKNVQAIDLREYDISELVNLRNNIRKAQTREMHMQCKDRDTPQSKFPH